MKYGVVLFPGFQLLDVAGPLDILNLLSQSVPLELSILSSTLEPVSTLAPGSKTTFGQSIVPTHTFADAPDDIEVLLVPGGLGCRDEANIKPAVDYVKKTFPKLKFLITVCTGSHLVAQAGVLDGVRATSNKAAFAWVGKALTTTQALIRMLTH
jgi:putative intracellular protease/amidase